MRIKKIMSLSFGRFLNSQIKQRIAIQKKHAKNNNAVSVNRRQLKMLSLYLEAHALNQNFSERFFRFTNKQLGNIWH